MLYGNSLYVFSRKEMPFLRLARVVKRKQLLRRPDEALQSVTWPCDLAVPLPAERDIIHVLYTHTLLCGKFFMS